MLRPPMLVIAALAVVLGAPPAFALTVRLIASTTGPGTLKDHTPGPDLRIGTADDTMVSSPSGVAGGDSGPNTHGAASFALLNGSAGAPFPTWGDGTGLTFNYLLFVDGTIEFTPDYAASSASDLVLHITGCAMRSTAEFNYNGGAGGRGEAMTSGCTGTAHYNPFSGTASVVLSGTFAAPFDSFPLVDQTLSAGPGKATIVLRSQFGTTGNAYVDTVLTPLVPSGATALALVEFRGRTNEPTHQDWASQGVLAAYTIDDLGCALVFPSLVCNGGSTTTTTLPGGGGGCTSFPTCEPSLVAALPDPTAVTGPARKVARALGMRERQASHAFARAETATGKKQTKLFKKCRTTLTRLDAKATSADGRQRLGVPLAPIQAAVTLLLGFLP